MFFFRVWLHGLLVFLDVPAWKICTEAKVLVFFRFQFVSGQNVTSYFSNPYFAYFSNSYFATKSLNCCFMGSGDTLYLRTVPEKNDVS